MTQSNALDTIVYINLPEGFSLSKNAMHIDTTIPLPVQLPVKNGEIAGKDSFDISELTQEMILAGILTVMTYDKENKNIQYYRSILNEARPNLKKELTEAAILKARNEDWDIAEEIFQALRGLDPDDMAIVLNTALFFDQRAESYRNSGLNDDADAYDESALNFYKIAMAAEPAIPDAFFNAAFFYLRLRNFSRGKECFETFLTLTSELSEEELGENGKYKRDRAKKVVDDITSRNLDDELFKTAFDYISMGQEEKGMEAIREFLEKNPEVWNAWFMLGWALRRLERYEDAKSAFEEAISLGGNNCDTYNELAICCMELNLFEESRKNLSQALQLEPENTKIMSNLGFLALKEGDISTARQYFTAVLEFDPDDQIVKTALEDME